MTAQDYSDDGAKEQAKQAAGNAADEGKHVAGVAKDEAQNVAQEAKDQARNLLGEARSQLEEQSRTQRDRLVSTLRTVGDDLDKMASGEGASHGMAQDVTRQVAHRARELSARMDGREPTELLDDVRDFARRKPGVFLLGALAAGVVAGRMARGAKEAHGANGVGSGATDESLGTANGSPLAGTGYPADPVYPIQTDPTRSETV